MSYRTDKEWVEWCRRWHAAYGLPLPPTFPDNDKMRDAAQDMYLALCEAIPILQTEMHKAQCSYGSVYSEDRTKRTTRCYEMAKTAIEKASF